MDPREILIMGQATPPLDSTGWPESSSPPAVLEKRPTLFSHLPSQQLQAKGLAGGFHAGL